MVQLNSPACLHFVSAIVMETQRKFMVDTGAAVSLLSSKMWRAMGGKNAVISVGWKTVGWCGGSPVMVLGVCTLQLRFVDLVLQADFVVADLLQVESIIGLDFLEAHHCIVDLPNKLLQFRGVSVSLERHQ